MTVQHRSGPGNCSCRFHLGLACHFDLVTPNSCRACEENCFLRLYHRVSALMAAVAENCLGEKSLFVSIGVGEQMLSLEAYSETASTFQFLDEDIRLACAVGESASEIDTRTLSSIFVDWAWSACRCSVKTWVVLVRQ